ncbi:MAG: Phosphate regulon transcriptional regulatory protein PhoB (SphR) [Candidatus Magasanikbacteria bacterium GW2011_GWA2_37_8]|uniref:Phosphate regulon transcriptional regulatory protein PhoB (SphR) n=1 Tax=Candidatus Magasanikbacteria bacterium GW2011_GWA2_37_8 TaxID=1619036 RepID=A0A0G0HCJ2_9BACT|nr:MAG: Phosphate regulon transcriptional regulatory protein PhoB (SphR) [Candidatus Magasanikbacteria bacterium GW2011_GWA2_37_8]
MATLLKKILIVEDESALVEVLRDKLEEEKVFKVCVAKDGVEGLKMVSKCKPDLILLDIVMPRMDGITMMIQLKKIKEYKKIPIVVLTNLGTSDDAENAIKQGAYDFLIKAEWKLDDVISKIRKILKV